LSVFATGKRSDSRIAGKKLLPIGIHATPISGLLFQRLGAFFARLVIRWRLRRAD
jgi:hypothetical protein